MYKAMLGNGIGKNGGNLGIPYGFGTDLAYSGQIGIEPEEGLRIITSGMINQLKKGAQTQFDSLQKFDMQLQIGALSVVYLNMDKNIEFIAEMFINKHAYKVKTLGNVPIYSGFAYVGYKLSDNWIPYLSLDVIRFSSKPNPYIPATNQYLQKQYESMETYSAGFRYKFSASAVFKLEYGLTREKFSGISHGFKTQFAFAL